MKYAAAVNANNFSSSYGREYISLSPKLTASATYTEGFNLSSPKTLATKGFVLAKSSIDTTSLLNRGKKADNPLMMTNKAKTSEAMKSYTPNAFSQGQSTPSHRKDNLAVNASGLRGKSDKKSSSASKIKSDSYRPMSSTPKNASSSRIAESVRLKDDAGTGRWKKLEISTEFNNSTKNSYVARSQTTKHTEVDENGLSKSSLSLQQSIQMVQKSLQAKSMNTNGLNSTAENKEIKFDSKFRSNRPQSSSSAKDRGNSLSRDNTSKENKSNTFFQENYGNRTPQKGGLRSPSSGKKTTATLQSEEELSQSTLGAKKLANSTNFELRNNWQNQNDSMRKERRPLSAKKPARDSSKDDLERGVNNKGDKTPTQKVSLQAFVTKVNKGDVFSSIKTYSEKRDNSARKNQQRPYLNLEDNKGKPIKAGDFEPKGAKTTTNTDSKTFAVSLNKPAVNAVAAPTQTMPPRNSKNTKSNGSAVKEGAKLGQEVAIKSVREKERFIYYQTNLARAHRWEGDNDYFVQIYKEHFVQSFQALSFCKNVKLPDISAIAQKRVNLPRRESHKGMKTVVFDMDETLIHCNESLDMPADVILPIVFPNGEVVEAGVNIRPYAIEILKELSQYYEIVVFTASHSCYANVVLDYLDPEGQYIHHRLFRESCVVTDEGIHIKDLRVIGNRDMKDLILVDNAAYSFCFQIENGIPIIPFYDNKADEELKRLIPYLKFLSSVKDLREINKQTFKLHLYTSFDLPDAVIERLVFQD